MLNTAMKTGKNIDMSLLDLYRSAKQPAYYGWMKAAAWGIQGLMVAALLCSAFALHDGVQSEQYGPLILAVGLAAAQWYLFSLFRDHPDIRPTVYDDYGARTRRFQAMAFVICVPLALSWFENETLYGGMNPRGHWLEARNENAAKDCDFERQMVARSGEKLEVLQNQQRVGLATSYDVVDHANGFKLIAGLYNACIEDKAKRKAGIQQRLVELTSRP